MKMDKFVSKSYKCWANMKSRCDNPNSSSYSNYGARGITYDPRWKSFSNFLKDLGEAPKGFTLKRIDNNKGYFKENCKWATYTEQNRNTRHNTFIKGKTLSKWCEELNIKSSTLCMRLYVYKWPIEKVLSQPIRKYNA